MATKKYRVIEFSVVLLLIVFIIAVCGIYSGGSKKNINEITPPVEEILKSSSVTKKSNGDAVKAFGFDLNKTEGLAYWSDDNVMDVSEVLIVKLNDEKDVSEFKEAIETHIVNQKNLYKSYAPKQYSLLENSVVESSGNMVFYCTAKNAGDIYEAYANAL